MTGKRRLQVLANYLRSGAVDTENFDMGNWPTCAVGEGSRIPSLAKEGLSLWEEVPHYNGRWDYDAVAKFFNIPYTTAEKIFGCARRKASTVARQIEEYLYV